MRHKVIDLLSPHWASRHIWQGWSNWFIAALPETFDVNYMGRNCHMDRPQLPPVLSSVCKLISIMKYWIIFVAKSKHTPGFKISFIIWGLWLTQLCTWACDFSPMSKCSQALSAWECPCAIRCLRQVKFPHSDVMPPGTVWYTFRVSAKLAIANKYIKSQRTPWTETYCCECTMPCSGQQTSRPGVLLYVLPVDTYSIKTYYYSTQYYRITVHEEIHLWHCSVWSCGRVSFSQHVVIYWLWYINGASGPEGPSHLLETKSCCFMQMASA